MKRKTAPLILLFMACLSWASAQVTVTQSFGQIYDVETVSVSFTVPAGTSRLLVVQWQGDPDFATYSSGDITYNGMDLDRFGSTNVFYLYLGTGTAITADMILNPGAPSSGGLSMAAFSGVDSTTPVNDVGTASTGTGTITVMVPGSDTGDMIFDGAAGVGITSLTPDAAQTLLDSDSGTLTAFGGAAVLAASSFKSNSSGMGATMSWMTTGFSAFGAIQAANILWDGVTAAIPEIDIQGNNVSITDGDNTPDTIDDTNFGAIPLGDSDTHTFTIQNLASGPLVIPPGGIVVNSATAGVFTLGTVSQALPATLGWMETMTFEVVFTPSAGLGTPFTGSVAVTSDDPDEMIYNFDLAGIGGTTAGAINFDGTNDYITAPNPLNPATTDFTFEARFRFTGNSTFTILSLRGVKQILEVKKTGNVFTLQTRIANANISGSTNLSAGTWYHAAVTYYTNLGGTGTLTLYLNGVQEASATTTPISSTDNLIFGANVGNAGAVAANMAGDMDEVRIWNRALCAGEILDRISCPLDGDEPELIHYYDFQNQNAFVGANNAGQTTLEDKVGANDGTLVNFGLTGATSNWIADATTGACGSSFVCNASSPIINSVGTHQSRASGTVGSYTYYCDCAGNLLLALDIGFSGAVIPTTGVKVKVESPAATFHPFNTGFISNLDGGAIMTRRWEVSPTVAPTGNVGVRFFFTAADYNAVNTVLSANPPMTPLSQVSDLEFFNVLSDLGEFPAIASIMPDDAQVRAEGGSSTTQYTLGNHGTDYYAEFLVEGLVGGGGGGGGAAQASLPVEMTSFTARLKQDKTVELQWSTASELNNYGFEVEHRRGKKNWKTIGFVPGNGTSNVGHQYSFLHRSPKGGFNYYRLKQIDEDGRFDLSDGRSVWLAISDVTLYPNPTTGIVQWDQNTNSNARVRVTDSQGRVVMERTVSTPQLDLSALAPGLYSISIQTDEQTTLQRIIKE